MKPLKDSRLRIAIEFDLDCNKKDGHIATVESVRLYRKRESEQGSVIQVLSSYHANEFNKRKKVKAKGKDSAWMAITALLFSSFESFGLDIPDA